MDNNKIIDNAKKYVNKLLVPLEEHYYHSYNHAIEVMERAIYLGKKEGLEESDLEILGLAGLFHDTGFVIQYDNNEEIGSKIAKNYLKSILYSEKSIKTIQRLIVATDPSYTKPVDIYEQIIKDADMDNLGRKDFFEKANDLKKEREIIKKIIIKDPDWNHASIDILKEHKFKTFTQKTERNSKKDENLKKMINELEKNEHI